MLHEFLLMLLHEFLLMLQEFVYYCCRSQQAAYDKQLSSCLPLALLQEGCQQRPITKPLLSVSKPRSAKTAQDIKLLRGIRQEA